MPFKRLCKICNFKGIDIDFFIQNKCLDHIKPISLALDEISVLELNYYKNFQPLWAIDNRTKSNSFDEELTTL